MNKSTAKFSVIALSSFLAISSAVLAADAKEGIVRGSYINLRAEPRFNSPIVGKMIRGDKYKIEFEQSSWLKVKFKEDTTGWIFKTLVESGNENEAGKKVASSSTKLDEAKAKKDDKKKTDKPVVLKDTSKEQTDKPLINTGDLSKLPEVVSESGSAEDLYNEAIKLYEQRKYSEALDKNKSAAQKAPKNAEILNNLGNCQFKLGRIEDALKSWTEALKIAPRSGKICNNLGIAYYQLDKNEEAVEYYKKAIAFEPDFSDPYYNLASVNGFMGNFAEAIKYYEKYLTFKPDDTMKKLADERIKYCQRQLDKAK